MNDTLVLNDNIKAELMRQRPDIKQENIILRTHKLIKVRLKQEKFHLFIVIFQIWLFAMIVDTLTLYLLTLPRFHDVSGLILYVNEK